VLPRARLFRPEGGEHLRHTILNGDVIACLRSLPDACVQCVVTSPPYWGLRDYGVEGQIGLEPTPEEHVERMVEVFREVRRVLRDDGVLWLNYGDCYYTGGRGSPDADANRIKDPNSMQASHSANAIGCAANRRDIKGMKPKDLVGMPWRIAFALQQPYYVGKIRSEKDRIWLAAMVEAEGCLFIHKRKAGQNNGQGYKRKSDTYGVGLEVASTDRAIVERCKDITGMGSICHQSPSQNGRRKQTIYRWNLRSNACRDIILELYPYFVAKKQEARLLLFCPPSGSDAEKAHESLKAIHQGGPATIDFPEPAKELAALWEPGWYLRSDVIWSKCNPMPESATDRPTKSHEYVFLLTKSSRYFYDADAIREPYAESTFKRAKSVNNAAARKDNGTAINQRGLTAEQQTKAYSKVTETGGRNKRSVWHIATQSFSEAHFATFPEALVEPCIKAGTSERGCCPECGAPLMRMVEKEYRSDPQYVKTDEDPILKGRNRNVMRMGDGVRVSTVGWQPTCTCNAGDPIPCVVLDPFGGSGTVAKVARDLGRSSILIEINPEYVQIAKKRLRIGEQLDSGVCEYVVKNFRTEATP